MNAEDLHERLALLGDESHVAHHPMCAAHPALDDGTCCCVSGQLAAVIRALTGLHRPHPSRSIYTLDCPLHDVRKGPAAWRDDVDYDACPDCVVTPITVCSGDTCESYPCATVRVVAEALLVAER